MNLKALADIYKRLYLAELSNLAFYHIFAKSNFEILPNFNVATICRNVIICDELLTESAESSRFVNVADFPELSPTLPRRSPVRRAADAPDSAA